MQDETTSFIIRQKKEWGEILTGLQHRNRYTVMNPADQEVFSVAEEGGNFLLRWFLKSLRPFTLSVKNMEETELLRLHRPFRFFFHRLEVHQSDGKFLGSIERRFSFLRRIYTVRDSTDQEVATLFGPILNPWTFRILQNEQEVGRIVKKWSGLGKEMFTAADNFGVTFPANWDASLRSVVLGAVFLVDFAHFEDTNRN